MLQVDKETFDTFLKQFVGGTYEKIRWSSPIRYNFYAGEEMLGYKYDSYGEDPPEYYIMEDKFYEFRVIDGNGQMGWCFSFYDHFEILWDDGEYANWIADLSVLGIEKMGR